MKYLIFLFLYTSLSVSGPNIYAQETTWLALADSAVTERTYNIPIEKPEEIKDNTEIENLHFQFDTDNAGQSKILIHLSDTVKLLTISTYNLLGESQEAIRKQQLNPGFYEFDLPKNTAESLKYWQVSMEGQKVISFIR